MAQIIDGKALAASERGRVTSGVEALKAQGHPCSLAVVLVGEDQASQTYVRLKHNDCVECGVTPLDVRLPAQTTQEELNKLIEELNADPKITGILVQFPLPKHLSEDEVVARIDAKKDVDGFSAYNLGSLVRNDPQAVVACTPYGVMRMIESIGVNIDGKNAVVVGRSSTVGKPMSFLLLNANATVTVAHSHTADLQSVCREADILVVATGKAEFITAEYVKPGAVVIDVGMDRNAEGKLVGDVDFASVEPVAGYITPVPGGVGPMTRAELMVNTYITAARQAGVSNATISEMLNA